MGNSMHYLVKSWALMLLLLVVATASARAQQIEDIVLTAGADPVWSGGASQFAGFSFHQGNYSTDTRRDLLIGAPGRAGVAGRVYVIFGGPPWSGRLDLDSTASALIVSTTPGEEFGFATTSGHIVRSGSGDPWDIAVGAPGADDGRGRVYLFSANLREGDQLTTADAKFVVVGDAGDNIGAALAALDINNDGYRDLVIGSRTNRVYVIYGRPDLSGTLTLPAAASSVLAAPGIGEVLERGDVNGDGVHDLLLGAPRESSLYLLTGRTGGYPSSVALETGTPRFTGVALRDQAGTSARTADIDGDGIQDIIIGAPYSTGPSGRADAGAVYVLWGGPGIGAGRSLADADVTLFGASAGALAGIYIATGHINRDHREDVVLSAPLGAGGAGELLVKYGSARSMFGPADASGRRRLDLAEAGNIDRRIIGDSSLGPIRAAEVFEITGEGARDVLVGIPAANNSGGEVHSALSPRLQPSTRNVTLTVPEGGRQAGELTVRNPSVMTLSWAASSAVPWLTVSPAEGISSRAGAPALQLTGSAQRLAPGTHSGTARLTSTSHHLVMFTDINVSLTVVETRFAAITSPSNGTTQSGSFTVTGWAIDKGATSGTGVDRVEIWAYPSSGTAFLVATAVYGAPRPDVATAHGSRFENSGFTATISGLGTGTYRLVARARSAASGEMWEKAEVAATTEAPPSSDDLDGDGQTDFLWQHATEGWLAVWRLANGQLLGGYPLSVSRESDLKWKIVGSGDFDRDGKTDFLWRHQGDGRLRVWYMNGANVTGSAFLSNSVPDLNWRVAGIADLDGDGWPDILWHDQQAGWLAVWRLQGVNLLGGMPLNENRVADTNWQIASVRDFSGDGRADILWHHRSEGWLAFWRMEGSQVAGGIPLSHNRVADTNWKAIASGDMNNDGYPDLIWRHTNGTIAIWALRRGELLGGVTLSHNGVEPVWALVLPR